MAHTAYLVCLVSTVNDCCKTPLKSKREWQAQNKASRLGGQSGLPNVCFCFVPAMSTLVWLKHIYRKSLNRLLKVWYVPATSAVLMAFFFLFFCCGH